MDKLVIFQIIEIIISVVLTVLILVQSKGSGLFSAFSGSIGFYRSRRGLEKVIFILTIVMGVLLIVNSLLLTLLR